MKFSAPPPEFLPPAIQEQLEGIQNSSELKATSAQYALRIHYLLAAGFNVSGNLGHQVETCRMKSTDGPLT